MKRAQYYGEDKLFLTFSRQETLSYSTILQNIMIMLIHDDSDELLSNAEAYEALENLSKEDYDDLHDRICIRILESSDTWTEEVFI